ncbi:hypothetical protein ACWDTG_02780 [Rhodococcus zopfii]
MSADDLTASEILVLLALMAESHPVPNPELKTLGPELRPDSRKKLNRLGLIETDTSGRPYTHVLADGGWARCYQEIGSAAPPKAGPYGRTLYTMLAAMRRYFDRADLRPSDVFLPAATATDSAPVGTAESGAVEDRVRIAYARLAERPGAWVRLTDLREVLADVPRDELDRELARMYRLPDVVLVPEENQKALTERDRAAAVVIGFQNNHAIAIEAQ